MLKKFDTFYLLKCCLLFVGSNVFSQTEIYKSDFVFDAFKSDKIIEPNQRTADEMEARAKQNRCTEPDPKKIEAAKAAQEKLKNKN